MASSGILYVTTPEPLALQLDPREDFLLMFEDIADEDETPIPHTTGVIVMDLKDNAGVTKLTLSTANGYIVRRAGVTNILDITFPWSVIATLPAGQYDADLVERLYDDTSRTILTSFTFQRLP